MSEQHPMILFVGHPEQGAQLLEAVEPLGWWVYQPQNANEALGMYVSYLPDVVLLNADAAPDITEEVYYHLASVLAEPMIVISDDELWSDRVTHHLSADAHVAEIIARVGEATGALEVIH
ncbi:MAG: hypothetical protein ABI970_20845 [Chloroflexota bacterium]